MNINTNTIVSMTDANQNFSKVAKVAEKNGEAVIFKNNKPKFMLIDMKANPYLQLTDDDVVEISLGVASGKISYEQLVEWVKEHRT